MTEGMTIWLLIIALLGPLLLPLLLWRPVWREGVLRFSPLAALPALLLALFGVEGVVLPLPWLFLGTELGLDATGRIFLLFSAWLWLLAAWFAAGYLADDRRSHLFLLFFLPAMSGNFGLIVARDLISFNVFFTLMGLCAYGLIIHRRDPAAFRAGRIYLALVVLGEVLIFIGLVGLVWGTGGALQMGGSGGIGGLSAPLPAGFAACLLLGFGIKAGMLPLHFWLPLAHPAAPVPASALLSGAMIKAGVLGWLRFLPTGEGVATGGMGGDLAPFCLAIGLLAAFYGAVRGLSRDDPKTVLAWSSISQMGLLTVGLGLFLGGGTSGESALAALLLFALHHGLAKGALFLTVGVAAANPRPALILALLPALSLAGAPLTSGFIAKNLLLEAATQPLPAAIGPLAIGRDGWSWLLSGGSLLTALLLLHFLRQLKLVPQKKKKPTGLAPLLILVFSGLPLFWFLVPPLAELRELAPTSDWGKGATALLPLLAALFLAGLAVIVQQHRRSRRSVKLTEGTDCKSVPDYAAPVSLPPASKTVALQNDYSPLYQQVIAQEPTDPLAFIMRRWQRYATKTQNLRAATHCRRRRLLVYWQRAGQRPEELLSSWPLAGCGGLALLLFFFLLIRLG